MTLQRSRGPVLVACPDARPPAYQAVIGLHRVAKLHGFVTASYYDPASRLASISRRLAPAQFAQLERVLLRRHDPEIPPALVQTVPSFDVLLRLEARLGERLPHLGRVLAQYRTKRFDAQLARAITRNRPELLLTFSDVGSMTALPLCRRLGIKTIVSMVHGDVREEQEVLDRESARSPEFMPIYLGSSDLDRVLLAWLHDRRLRDLALADRVLVPSRHIAETLVRYGTPAAKLHVIPYAADCRRFHPPTQKHHGQDCTFLFAGGVCHRKGIKYLLEAWRQIRRPGWRLQLLGPLPANLGPLKPYLDFVEPLGRVSQSEMPARMASADVFVFPSLFEGSAVVTYEALATGLPSVVTPSAGSVVRDGVEGFVVPSSQVDSLAFRMEQLGNDPGLRASMGSAARARALSFDWPQYHESLIAVVDDLLCAEAVPESQAQLNEHIPRASNGESFVGWVKPTVNAPSPLP
jgi:alpha-maltose-1-phosphate synthase